MAERIRIWLQEQYLPTALLGMKGAAAYLGLLDKDGRGSSNSLSMRLRRGHPLRFVAEIDGNRLTTRDLLDEYIEVLPDWGPKGDHDARRAS
ncbi:MAG TPA: hypothetical protein VJW23_12070 [Propionibacteriaceae bacterium]|nr:hypothetical protein [Propionibacteriaceae bacterium]